jgi:hypothetical protein
MLFYFDIRRSRSPASGWILRGGYWFSAFEGLHPPLVYYAPSGLEKRLAFVEGLHPSLMYFALTGLVGIRFIFFKIIDFQ